MCLYDIILMAEMERLLLSYIFLFLDPFSMITASKIWWLTLHVGGSWHPPLCVERVGRCRTLCSVLFVSASSKGIKPSSCFFHQFMCSSICCAHGTKRLCTKTPALPLLSFLVLWTKIQTEKKDCVYQEVVQLILGKPFNVCDFLWMSVVDVLWSES